MMRGGAGALAAALFLLGAWAGREFESVAGVAMLAFLAGLAGTALVSIAERGLLGRVRSLRAAMIQIYTDGDLSRRVDVIGKDDLAQTGEAFNRLLGSFQAIIGKIYFDSLEVSRAASRFIADAKQVSEASQAQREAADDVAQAMHELVTGIREVARHVEETAEISRGASRLSQQGTEEVGLARNEIVRIADSVEESAKVVQALGEHSLAIGRIADVIHDIADQTNLLALNAAIEAARAGEQGRGFAVVADEVRKLAERTTAATGEISAMIESIRRETGQAIASIGQGSRQARVGADMAQKVARSLDEISAGARATGDKVEAIAAAIAQQNTHSEQIDGSVEQIRSMVEANSEASQQTAQAAAHLEQLADNLKEVGSVFKLGEAGQRAVRTHEKMPALAREMAASIGTALEEAISSGKASLEDIFDREYRPIQGTKPQKFKTRYDDLTDRLFPPIQEPILERDSGIVYAGAVDVNGYFPTHNKRFSQPLTGDEKVDLANNRTKRIFNDPVGKCCGAHEQEFLLQTYRRDTGEIMHDISAPVYVHGRHWGGVRIGYRTEA